MAPELKVINLARTPERMARFIDRNPTLEARRFPAVDGALLDRNACIRDGIITSDNTYLPGALGCALSHINLWRECAAGSQSFHVAEDDGILRHDFHAVAGAMLGDLPNWDIVLWTQNLDWPVQVQLAPGIGTTVVQYDHEAIVASQFQASTVRPILARLVSAAGTGCYSISPRGAANVLRACLPLGNAPPKYLEKHDMAWHNTGIDVELCRHYAALQAYIALPMLATSDNEQTASTIRGHLAAIHDPRIANRAPPTPNASTA